MCRDTRHEKMTNGAFWSAISSVSLIFCLCCFFHRTHVSSAVSPTTTSLRIAWDWGIQTQRQWSDRAILRETPGLLGLYSLVALWVLYQQDQVCIHQAA